MTNENLPKRICQISKRQVAHSYFPHVKPHTAVCHLMAWILRSKPLCQELAETGYTKKSRYFTPHQVTRIQYYLGDPEDFENQE